MTLLRAADLHVSFGARTLFDQLTLTIEEGERVGLIGVNGSGKSTLMKILAGAMKPDSGLQQLKRGARITYLPQEPEFAEGATVESELSVAQAPLRDALAEHAALATQATTAADPTKLLERMAALSDRIEHLGGWDTEHLARKLLDRLGVHEWEKPVAALSGGQRKRVAIARALLTRPDLLMLDEPTNHLDADTVDWLEEELDTLEGSLLLVTHDRYFLDDLVDRIVEIQPGGGVVSYPGNYEAYLEQKLVAQENAALAQHKRERWIMQEVAWLRRGPEARRTKSKARIERARKLMAERGFQRPKIADLQLSQAPRLGGSVLEARKVSKRFGEKTVLRDVDLIVQKGERIGFVGPNGAGKTTFLRVLLGELPADGGQVIRGPSVRVAYYDQQRATLDPEATVYEAASPGEDWIEIGSKRIHLRDYLDDLLFPVPMQKMQVKALSGGERNRLLLARLFLEGANVLVLDEPTNDLDLVTLNVLERLLVEFGGSVLLVTHDRYFLDKTATAILSFEGDGRVVRYEGNYDLYRRLKAQSGSTQSTAAAKAMTPAAPTPAASATQSPKGRLSYMEQREFDGIEGAIEAAETRQRELEALLADPATYSRKELDAGALNTQLEQATAEVARLYARWEELSAKKGG